MVRRLFGAIPQIQRADGSTATQLFRQKRLQKVLKIYQRVKIKMQVTEVLRHSLLVEQDAKTGEWTPHTSTSTKPQSTQVMTWEITTAETQDKVPRVFGASPLTPRKDGSIAMKWSQRTQKDFGVSKEISIKVNSQRLDLERNANFGLSKLLISIQLSQRHIQKLV